MKEHLKRVAKVFTGSTPPTNISRYYDSEDVYWFSPGDMSSEGIDLSEPRKISKSFIDDNGIRLYPANAVLMVGIGATVGKIGFSERPCYTNQQINTIIFNETKVLPKYGAYFLLNKSSEINKKTPIVTLQIFNQSKVKQVMIDYPSLSVQQRIVDYLDAKISEIDKRVSVLEKQQDAYARLKKSVIHQAVTRGLNTDVCLKDSGIEWIGMIPEYWMLRRVKEVCRVVCGATPKDNPNYWDGEIKWVSPADMADFGEIEKGARTITGKGYLSCGTTLVPSNSIIMSTRAPIGKTNIALTELCTNQGCKCLTSKALNMRFMLYYIWSKKDKFQALGRGTTFIELSTKDLSSFWLALPPLTEQQTIASYLDEKCAKIDAAIDNIGKQIEASKRLKRAIINEAISGKTII